MERKNFIKFLGYSLVIPSIFNPFIKKLHAVGPAYIVDQAKCNACGGCAVIAYQCMTLEGEDHAYFKDDCGGNVGGNNSEWHTECGDPDNMREAMEYCPLNAIDVLKYTK